MPKCSRNNIEKQSMPSRCTSTHSAKAPWAMPPLQEAVLVPHISISQGFHSNIYYYTPLPLNLANKQQQATSKQASKHFSFPFWPLLRLIAPGSTLL